MNIAVMSPHCHGNGNTTVAALVAAALAKQNTKVCLTHLTGKSEAIFPYYNITNMGANTADAIQLTKLIRTGGMQKNSLSNYCKSVSENYDIFSLDSQVDIPDEEIADVIRYIAQNAPYDYVIFDVDENSLDKPNTQAVIENADCILLVMSQAITELNRFMQMKATFISRTSKIPKIVIVNKYRNILGTVKEFAAKVGVKDTKHWHPIHHNLYIRSLANNGQMLFLTEAIRKREGEVVELDTDIQKIVKDIITTKHAMSKTRAANSLKEEELDE